MSKTANLNVWIEPDVKTQAERILATLGISGAEAINLFYKQIILQKGIPFELKIPRNPIVDASNITENRMNSELEKGYTETLNGKAKSAKEVFANIRKDYQII